MPINIKDCIYITEASTDLTWSLHALSLLFFLLAEMCLLINFVTYSLCFFRFFIKQKIHLKNKIK